MVSRLNSLTPERSLINILTLSGMNANGLTSVEDMKHCGKVSDSAGRFVRIGSASLSGAGVDDGAISDVSDGKLICTVGVTSFAVFVAAGI